MGFNRRRIIGAALATAASLSLASCLSAPRHVASAPPVASPARVAAPALHRATLIDEAKAALAAHAGKIPHRDRIGVVDFSLPSSRPRFHIVDVASGRIERSYLVAHGSGSDPHGTGVLQQFSNVPGSFASARGAYLTADAYVGEHGRSRRLVGLDAENDMALERAIVIHGAPYVDPRLIASQGRIGRSQGCFAFAVDEVASVMELLGEGRMIYAGKMG